MSRIGVIASQKRFKPSDLSGLIHWSDFSRKNNQSADRDRATDLSGSGTDLALNGFAFSQMSGYNGYLENFNTFGNGRPDYIEFLEKTDSLLKYRPYKTGAINTYQIGGRTSINFKARVTGLDANRDAVLNLVIYYRTPDGDFFNITEDGTYEFNLSAEATGGTYCRINTNFSLKEGHTADEITPITIEQIPEYPGALVFDGIDDYLLSGIMPDVDDYTIIAKRRYYGSPIEEAFGTVTWGGYISIFEWGRISPVRDMRCTSFSSSTTGISKAVMPELISWQTSDRYNGINITKGSLQLTNTKLNVGVFTGYSVFSKMALYDLIIYNRTLSQAEIDKVVKYLKSK
ncbi:hypothetical protein D0T49_12445 [Paludibacter sp. 221]|uniref:hypothetical protein n=1 Tax=Paludibacter sp. 221 TaxID=2302939 RepID=UPI0013D4B6F4|nr:hypothetical protein [Paludibacter sp. 221]NDV47856.1 hypothetical protein [Paludibacter sp. 221]